MTNDQSRNQVGIRKSQGTLRNRLGHDTSPVGSVNTACESGRFNAAFVNPVSIPQIEQRVFGLNKFSKVSWKQARRTAENRCHFSYRNPLQRLGCNRQNVALFHLPSGHRLFSDFSDFSTGAFPSIRFPTSGRLTVTDHQIGLSAHSAQCHSVSGSVKAKQAQKPLSLCAFPPKWLYWRSPLISSN